MLNLVYTHWPSVSVLLSSILPLVSPLVIDITPPCLNMVEETIGVDVAVIVKVPTPIIVHASS